MTEQQVLDMQAVAAEFGFGETERAAREAELEARGLILRPGGAGYSGPPESPRKAQQRRRGASVGARARAAP